VRCLQAVQNAAARLINNLRRSDQVTDALISLHWQHPGAHRVQDRLQSSARERAGAPRTCCSCISEISLVGKPSVLLVPLAVPPFKLPKIGSRAFPVAGPQM
jgi:hypothetical protein